MISKRNTPQRRHAILALLSEQGEVSVDALAKRFSTSEVTIRKDLAAMESHGLLLRRYGGAVPMPQELIGEAAQPVSPYKQAIGRAAAARIREHARIIIDSGSTTAAMIPELGHKPGLVVMTNSLNVVNALRELEHEPVLLMTGGPGIRIPSRSRGRLPSRCCVPMTSTNYSSAPTASISNAGRPRSTNCWA